MEREGKPVLEFVAVRRGDTGAWAIPGVSYTTTKMIEKERCVCELKLLGAHRKSSGLCIVLHLCCVLVNSKYTAAKGFEFGA